MSSTTEVHPEPLRISITGHRPGDLGQVDLPQLISDFLRRAVVRAKALELEQVEVITGGALGVDQEVAAAVAETAALDDIALTNRIILPFPIEVMAKRWRDSDRARLEALVAAAGGAQVIADEFSYGAYHARNQAMVDAAQMTVAFWNGKRNGGTFACVKYALKVGKPIYNALAGFRPLHPADVA